MLNFKKSIMLKDRILYVLIIFISVFSCQLTGDIDDVDPGFLVTPEIAIRDAATAEVVLIGIYTRFRKEGFQTLPQLSSYWGVSGVPLSTINNLQEVYANSPTLSNPLITNLYLNCYSVVSQVNSFNTRLKKLSKDEINDAEKNTLLGESAFLKASAYFYALRFFGQHWDLTSDFGIVLRPEDSANNSNAFPRSSVQESYDAILDELNFAIDNAPENGGPNYRGSKEVAQALKAKVLLFIGNYSEAAALANTVLTNTSKDFALDYKEMFKSQNTSQELFFAPYIDYVEDPFSSFRPVNLGNSIYEAQAITSGDPRLNTQKFWNQYDNNNGPGNFTPPFFRSTNAHLRLPELYLIHAEAAARAGSGVDGAALASLNVSRTRAAVGLAPLVDGVDITTKAELLDAIRKEKLLELFSEQGEPFLDIVRYHYLGDLDGTSIKSTLNSEHLFILPIPLDELVPAKGVVEQNPGYPSGI